MNQLMKLRRSRRLTREQLGERTGVTGRAIASYERCERIPRPGTLARLAEWAGMSAADMYGMMTQGMEDNTNGAETEVHAGRESDPGEGDTP